VLASGSATVCIAKWQEMAGFEVFFKHLSTGAQGSGKDPHLRSFSPVPASFTGHEKPTIQRVQGQTAFLPDLL
jgi:hypothetical protein